MDGEKVHQSLIQNSEAFADRPRPLSRSDLNTNLRSVNNTPYGSLWRLLRRNLVSAVVQPYKSTNSKSTHVEQMALGILLKRLKNEAETNGGIVAPVHSIQHAMSFLMASLCFGVKLDEEVVNQIMNVQRELLSLVDKHFALNLLPKVALLLFWKRLGKFKQVRRAQAELFIPLIRARKHRERSSTTTHMISYVDSLLELRVPNGVGSTRKLSEEDIVSFCSEFLDAAIWSTCAGLEWIMASLVKHQDIQEKLKKEIRGVVGEEKTRVVYVDELQKMPYLKAVILEALRRHPPAHFVIPHRVEEDVMMDEYLIPKDTVVNCLVTSIGMDGRVWEDPLEFRPERFMAGGEGEGVDVQCGKSEIKMMPFGAGRRMCPGLDMALLQLQYWVANIVNVMELKAVEGMEVDLSEKAELFVPMMNTFHARISFA